MDRAEAKTIAQDFVKELRREADMPEEDDLMLVRMEEIVLGWLFCVNSRIYLETGNRDYLVCGGDGDFMVRRTDGAIEDRKGGYVYPRPSHRQ